MFKTIKTIQVTKTISDGAGKKEVKNETREMTPEEEKRFDSAFGEFDRAFEHFDKAFEIFDKI